MAGVEIIESLRDRLEYGNGIVVPLKNDDSISFEINSDSQIVMTLTSMHDYYFKVSDQDADLILKWCRGRETKVSLKALTDYLTSIGIVQHYDKIISIISGPSPMEIEYEI